MKEKESIIKKIQKLLALGNADKNSSKEEAAVALKMAQDYMDKHNLSMSEVEIKNSGFENMTTCVTGERRRLQVWEKLLAQVVAIVCDTEEFVQGHSGRQTVMFVGMKKDVEFSVSLFGVFRKQMKLDAIKHFPVKEGPAQWRQRKVDILNVMFSRVPYKPPKYKYKKLRNDYLYALNVFVGEVATRQKAYGVTEYSNSRSLVIVKKDKVDEYIKEKIVFNIKKEPKRKKEISPEAIRLAREDSANFDLHNKEKLEG